MTQVKEEKDGSRVAPSEGFVKLIRHQIANLQRIIALESQGTPVAIEAFSFRQQIGEAVCAQEQDAPRVLRKDQPDLPEMYRQIEPRLQMISHLLAHLGRCGTFEAGGQPVSVESFRLKDLAFWARYPSSNLLDNLGELSSWCSSDCVFCFLKGAPMIAWRRPMLSIQEAKTRARYFTPAKQRGLPTPMAVPGEPLANPDTVELLQIVRETNPDTVMDLTTNGDFLSETLVDALAALKPLHISLSLNSSNAERRRRVMRSPRAEQGIRAAELLRSRDIQFTGSIVPSPNEPLDDVAETIRYLDSHHPIQIRLLLPGYTRYNADAVQFDTPIFWQALVDLADQMRPELSSPVLIQPSFYWNRTIMAYIDGIFPNSPAAHAGLQFGDLVTRVNEQVVISRAEAVHFLQQKPRDGSPWAVDVEIQRGRERFTVTLSNQLDREEDFYPYKPQGYAPSFSALARWGFGIQLADGFDMGALKRLKEIVTRHPEAERVLIFTTPLVRDLYAQALQIVGDSPECRLPDVEVRITMAQHNFWGGNIMIGDLHVVQDYIDQIRLVQHSGYHPDLVLIPGSFANAWGLDLLGHSYAEIERRTGTTVELIPLQRIMV